MSDEKRIWDCADLPLFSGTPIRVDPPKQPSDGDHRQRALNTKCGLCFDTGIILDGHDAKFCWCECGLEAWDHAQRQGEM